MSRENLTEIKYMCRYCNLNETEKEPRGIYCTTCRLEMAKGKIKSVLDKKDE